MLRNRESETAYLPVSPNRDEADFSGLTPVTVRNKTPRPLTLRRGSEYLHLPSLGEEKLNGKQVHQLGLNSLVLRRFVGLEKTLRDRQAPRSHGHLFLVMAISIWVAALICLKIGFELSIWSLILALVIVLPTFFAAVVPPIRFLRNHRGITPPCLDDDSKDSVRYRVYRQSAEALNRRSHQMAMLLLVLFVGALIPATTVYWFEPNREFFGRTAGLLGLAEFLQIIFIVTATVLPGLLYFLFDRHRMGTLRRNFELDIFRFDLSLDSTDGLAAKYGGRMDELYGDDDTGHARLLPGTRGPVLLATVLIMAGWLLTLAPVSTSDGRNDVDSISEIYVAFSPQPTALSFAFLGAYVFALTSLIRRYARSDLKPKAYSAISVRIISVVALTWVAERIYALTTGTPIQVHQQPALVDDTQAVNDGLGAGISDPAVATLFIGAFAIGMVPETFFTFLRESLWTPTASRLWSTLEEKHPLTRLDGIDIYDRFRLADEGVTNIEGLAHTNVVDLMLDTRIPATRLVDWVDQAILYLHMPPDLEKGPSRSDGSSAGDRGMLLMAGHGPQVTTETVDAMHPLSVDRDGAHDDPRLTIEDLRRRGIRTATDFVRQFATKSNEEKRWVDPPPPPLTITPLEPIEISDLTSFADQSQIQLVYRSLTDDEWFREIWEWRCNDTPRELRINLYDA